MFRKKEGVILLNFSSQFKRLLTLKNMQKPFQIIRFVINFNHDLNV